MKKLSKLCICAAVFAFCSSAAFADGMIFEPVEMPSISAAKEEVPAKTAGKTAAATTKAATEKAASTTKAASNTNSGNSFFDKFNSNSKPKIVDMSLKENQDMQNALVSLDTSQVELRQNLQALETKYAQTDAEYQKYKAERATLHKQIKAANKKLKNIESVKNKIRKNML